MSLAYEPSHGAGVLQHTAPRPAVFMPPHPSDEELAFNWTLSERDIDFILTNHRGPENLCRLAIQLCVLRQHGRFLATYTHVSPADPGLSLSATRPDPVGVALVSRAEQYRNRLPA